MFENQKEYSWKARLYYLDWAEVTLTNMYESGQITKRKKNKIKKVLDQYWIMLWDYYPDKNPLIEEAFKSSFG